MKIIQRWSLLVLLLLCTVAAFADSAQHRGIWLHPEQFKTPQLADETIEKIAAAHLNVIYPLVWHRGGTAWFKSSLSPMAADVPEGFDPLGYLVKNAHARGIDVHAWFVCGASGAAASSGVFARHPEWRQQEGRAGGTPWYDLGRPEVRKFECDVMLECVKNYELDGLHLDYIRYAGHIICYCEHCQNEFAQRYGFRPLHLGEERFPVVLDLSANPLGKPTTATVLAKFENSLPAITRNRLGEGEVVLLNWRAASSSSLAVDDFVKQTLARFGAGTKNTYQLLTTETAAKYRREDQVSAQQWLGALGFRTKIVDEKALAKVPRGSTLVLHGQYYISQETAQWIENFVSGGGHCLVVDGPAYGIKHAPLQRALGLSRSALFFHGPTVILPAPGQDELKAGPAVDVEKERQRMAKWTEYRTGTVTELVQAVYKGVKAIKPQVWVNAAVFADKKAADLVCQDWYGWLRQGCIDYVLPMAYTEKNETLTKQFAEWRAADPKMERITPGLSIYARKGGKAVPRELALIRSQLDMCRSNGAHGNLFFSFGYLNDTLTRLLANEVFSGPAKPWYPPRR